MRWVPAIACVAALTRVAAADTEVRGRVVDDETGSPIAGASVLLGDQAAVTDDSGDFTVDGEGTLTVTAAGYAAVTVAAKPGLQIRLSKKTGEVIEISGKAPEEAKPIAYVMTAKDIASTPGAMNDALRAITILPAASRIPFSFGGVVLRGMSPRDSSVFIDGVEIPLAFHFGGITGVFPTQALDNMRVVPSGFDVSMGRTQGGVVELTTRRPRGDAYRVGGEVSLLHSLVSAEGPVPGNGAALLTLRRSYFDFFVRPLVTRNDPLPSYSDGVLRAVWGEPAKKGELAAYLFGSLDRIANSSDAAKPMDPDADGHIAANLGFVRTGVTYKRKIDKTLVTLAPTLGTNILTLYEKDYPNDTTTVPDVTDISRRWYLFGGRGEWLRDDDHGFLRAGIDLEGGYLGRIKQTKAEDIDNDTPFPRNTVLWANAAIFAEARRHWYGDRLSVRPGLRFERFGLGEQWAVDPRVNAHATLTSTSTLRASLGRFHQPPSPAHFDEFADNLKAKSSYVDQATLAVELSPEEGVLASITGFYHEGRHTLVDIVDKNVRSSAIDLELIFKELLEEQIGLYGFQGNVGRQRTYGIETSMRYDKPRYRFLANFTWSRAKRQYDPALKLGWVPYGLDQPLRVNLLAATSARKWNFGARLTVASGNPLRWVPAGTPTTGLDQEPAPVLQRLPTFWQLDVRVDHAWKQSWGSVIGFLDLQNVTNHRNVEFRSSYPDENGVYRIEDDRGLPIIPYIGVEFAPR
ncbi:MAG TPA: TonB-dependent receptor [Kofleriaceae bacterium]|nr:TonB-dependent receptor [Kofleriaceae bacterium]